MWETHRSVASQVLPKWDLAGIPGMCQWPVSSQADTHYAEPCLLGNRSTSGKCGPTPTRKSQWGARFGGQDPCPRIGSPMGNQACIVPRLLWDLLLLKLPHPELRQQMFTSIFNFLKSVLNHPSMECNQFNHFPPLSCNILLFEVISSILSLVVCKR